MATNDKADGLGDDQGTRIGSPDHASTRPANHSDSAGPRPERTTGTGSEATQSTKGAAKGHETEHRSGYGGPGSEAVKPSDQR
jgi:hypothetical protein